jgi:DNA modification methylase
MDLRRGDALEAMASLGAGSVDAIVTDPPYGLAFMGKEWDHGVPGVPFWRQALRVAKPGAHLAAFGGTRTFHRLACAIEDAGFEIRDCLSWLYGSGFPKSLDVSKAIDKATPRAGMFDAFAVHFRERLAASGLTQKVVAAHFPSKTGGLTGCVWNWANGANVPTREQWQTLQPMLGLSTDWAPLIEREEAEREVLATEVRMNEASGIVAAGRDERKQIERRITAAATEAARTWEGWGTALKPAWEPIILARKPLIGTVAANVLEHGTGALNIDGCRIEVDDMAMLDRRRAAALGRADGYAGGVSLAAAGTDQGGRRVSPQGIGRWPANLVLDEEAAAMLDEQSGTLRARGNVTPTKTGPSWFTTPSGTTRIDGGDTGGASRFFYTAKASSGERHYAGKNSHPTVKPVDLMRWLVRLVTPPGGLVLDPFMGSGSTGVAALAEGFRFVGCELDAQMVDLARRRIAGPLFAEACK